MFRRQRGDQPVAAKHLDPDRGVVDRWSEQCDVDVTGPQRVQLRGREHLAADADLHVGQLVAQRAHEARQHRVRRRPDAPDGQVAFDALGDASRLLPGVVHRVEDGDDACEIRPARRRQIDPAGAPGEAG